MDAREPCPCHYITLYNPVAHSQLVLGLTLAGYWIVAKAYKILTIPLMLLSIFPHGAAESKTQFSLCRQNKHSIMHTLP